MPYTVEYFHPRVVATIEAWPSGLLADYTRKLELLVEFGPELRLPHSRAMGGGLLELRPQGREGAGRVFYCFAAGQRVVILHAFIKKARSTPARDVRIARTRMREAL